MDAGDKGSFNAILRRDAQPAEFLAALEAAALHKDFDCDVKFLPDGKIDPMFGTAEFFLRPLGGVLKKFSERNNQRANAARIRADVERLPAPRNRRYFPKAMTDTDQMLMESFASVGWLSERVVINAKTNLPGANILASKPSANSNEVVIVGAHHDTIRDSPGADDNTASVAALLELARLLQPYSFRHTILLAAFDMEERNRQGSRELVQQLVHGQKVRGAIIYETMCYHTSAANSQKIPRGFSLLYPQQMAHMRRRQFRGDWTAVLYRRSSVNMARTFGAALMDTAGVNSALLLRDITDLALIGTLMKRLPFSADLQRSDHLSFWNAGMPAILITDTADFRNPNYHRSTDTPDTLDYERAAAIVEATAVTVAEQAGWLQDENGMESGKEGGEERADSKAAEAPAGSPRDS